MIKNGTPSLGISCWMRRSGGACPEKRRQIGYKATLLRAVARGPGGEGHFRAGMRHFYIRTNRCFVGHSSEDEGMGS